MFTPATPKVFQTKNKVANTYTQGSKTRVYNYVYKSKRFLPLAKEWYSSIYAFNKNTPVLLPNSEKSLFKLVKSYFNLYSLKFNKKVKSKRSRVRSKRLTTNRLITGKPNLKHTNDKLNITVYIYDRRKKYYIKKTERIATLNLIKGEEVFLSFMKNLRKKNLELELNINKRTKILTKKAMLNNHISLKYFGMTYLSNYVKKCMRREIASLRYKQLASLEQSKHEKQHLLPLASLLERVYNKKVVFNIVNIKYFYNSSSIFSDALITKLKNKKNKPIKILGVSLNTFNLPPIDRLNVYNEMYNREKFAQYSSVKDLVFNGYKIMNTLHNKDVLDVSLLNSNGSNNTIKSKISTINLNDIIGSLKHKFTNGIRIEVAGRLTRRNTAARSLFKLRYKGNIKNMDSSHKRLSTVLLRGHAKSNLLYNQFKSKLRIGAFGLKTWVSSN